MKILHVIPSLGIGGTEKMLFELCRGLDRNRFQNEVVALKTGGAAAQKLRSAGFSVRILNSPDGFLPGLAAFPLLFFDLKLAIRESKPDIVHTWLTRANVMGRIAARSAGVSKVVSSLRVMEVEKGYHLFAERKTAGLASAVTVNSEALRHFAVESIGLSADKIRLIPNGIDTARKPDAEAAASNRKLWVKADHIAIGAVGRLHRQKGMDVLLDAAAVLLKEHRNVQFLIAGDGPERASLEAQAARLGIADSVTFCGWVEDSLNFIAALDIFALPSRWEGMPNAVMETMLAERSIVATRVSGVPDLLRDESEGLVVPPEDPGALSRALNRLVNDADFRHQLARAAHQKIISQFDLKNMIAAHEKLYQSL